MGPINHVLDGSPEPPNGNGQFRGSYFVMLCYVMPTRDQRTREGGSVAEWLACWTQAQKGLDSNRSRDAVR